MADQSLFLLAQEVKKMRNAQKQYFLQKGDAAKSKSKEALKLAANTLALCNHLEKLVDQRVQDILNAGKEAVSA